jgi:hypothetical protein
MRRSRIWRNALRVLRLLRRRIGEMSSRKVEDLRDRVARLGGVPINKNRRPLYRYTHKGINIEENEAWRWFVEMQLTGLETQELRAIENGRRHLGHASIMAEATPEAKEKDKVLYDRRVVLLEAAELRAEEILEQHPQEWHSWFRYFMATVWPAMQEPMEDEVHEGEEADHLMDFNLRYMDAFKHRQREEGEAD